MFGRIFNPLSLYVVLKRIFERPFITSFVYIKIMMYQCQVLGKKSGKIKALIFVFYPNDVLILNWWYSTLYVLEEIKCFKFNMIEYAAIYYQQSSVTAVNLYADNSSLYWTVVGFGDSQPSMELTKCQLICTLVPKKFLEIFSVWKRMSTRKHVPRVMTLLLMSFLPISITRRLFAMQIFDAG